MKMSMDVLITAILTTVASSAAIASGVDQPLVKLSVLDEVTSVPVKRFQVIPGVPYSGSNDRSVAAWQPHLARESAEGRYEWPQARSYEKFRLRVEAEGYRPTATDWINRADGPTEVMLKLRPDPGIHGLVLTPDGSPAAGATIGVALPNRTLRLTGSKIDQSDEPPASSLVDRWRQSITTRTDTTGHFRLTTETDPAALLVVVHKTGYFEQPFAKQMGKDEKPNVSAELRLAPWGRIGGRLLWGDRPGANEHVELIVSRETLYPDMVGTMATARSDKDGRFEFKEVPPGRAQISRIVSTGNEKNLSSYQFPLMHLDVKPGDGSEVVLGGRGRTVTGRLTGLDSYQGITLRLHPTAPHIGFQGDDAQWRGWSALRNSPAGTIVFRDVIPVGNDGTFRVEGLVPESYQIMVNESGRGLRGGTSFTVKPAPGTGEARTDQIESG